MSDIVHGGDVAGFLAEFGTQPLDFSANVSPLGLPMAVREAIVKALDTADRYPDPLCRELRKHIAVAEGMDANNIICGNGAADIIFRLVYALHPREALLAVPTFAEYEQALNATDCQIRYHMLQRANNFLLTDDILHDITPELDILFICQPNNPTGQVVSSGLMHDIIKRCTLTDTFLVVDECFVNFLDEPEEYTVKQHLAQYKNVLVLKAFTKMYAMAGVRLGYGLCYNEALLKKMSLMGQPWGVSSLAQEAGIAAIKQKKYVEQVRRLISTEKQWMLTELKKLRLSVIGHRANYIFFACSDNELTAKMRAIGVMIRDCSNYRGLGSGYYRVAVRTHSENEILLNKLGSVLG